LAATWTYSDWETYAPGTSTRWTRFNLYKQEVADALRGGSYSTEGKSHDLAVVADIYKSLIARHDTEAASAPSSGSTNRSSFTRARTI
jgi:hypothetical protein